jgi:hypothetical protein
MPFPLFTSILVVCLSVAADRPDERKRPDLLGLAFRLWGRRYEPAWVKGFSLMLNFRRGNMQRELSNQWLN